MHRRHADAAGRAKHQHALARRQPAALQQGVKGGVVGGAEHGGLRHVQFGRRRPHTVEGRHRQFGEAAGPVAHDHPVARLEGIAAPAGGDDRAGSLQSRHERQVGLELVAARHHQRIDIVDAPGLLPDQYFAHARLRIGPLLDGQHIGRAELAAEDYAHGLETVEANIGKGGGCRNGCRSIAPAAPSGKSVTAAPAMSRPEPV